MLRQEREKFVQSFCTHGRHNGRLLRSWSFMPQPRVAKGKPSLNFFTTQCFLYNIYSNPLRAGFSFRRFQTLILRLSPLIFCNLPPARSRFARGQHPPFLRTTAVAMEHRTKGKDRRSSPRRRKNPGMSPPIMSEPRTRNYSNARRYL